MATVDGPVFCDAQMLLEIEEQVVRRHKATRKEVIAHPVLGSAAFVDVRLGPVTEDVGEEEAVWPQPVGDAFQSQLPIPQVFEHFDGYDSIVAAGSNERFKVACDDHNIGDTTQTTLLGDEMTLRRRVG